MRRWFSFGKTNKTWLPRHSSPVIYNNKMLTFFEVIHYRASHRGKSTGLTHDSPQAWQCDRDLTNTKSGVINYTCVVLTVTRQTYLVKRNTLLPM